jgi:Ca2+-binding RTX toxin-like protein
MYPRFTPNQKKSDLTALVERICRRSHGSKPAMTTLAPKKERMIVETLEPRVLLSADFPVIAPFLANGIDQLDDTLDDFFSNELLNTPLPGITLFEQLDEETVESYAPTLTDLLFVDVSDTNENQDARSKLKEFDTNEDDKVTIQELSSGFVEKVRGFLDSVPTDPDDPNAKTSGNFRSFLETLDISNPIPNASNFLDISNVSYIENLDNTVVSLDFSFAHTQTLPIDLGMQAEKLGIALKSDIDVEVNQSLGFTLEFGIDDSDDSDNVLTQDDSDGVLTQDDFFIGLKGLSAKIDANADLNADINFGFLGASINNGSIALNANVKADDVQLSSSDLQNIPPNTFNVEKVSGNFDINLPIQVKTGLGNFNPQGLVIDVTADPFAQSLDDRRIDLDLKLDTNFDDLLKFDTLNSSDFINLLQQTVDFLDNLRSSEAISGFEIPFTKSSLGDVLDFADTFSDTLLYDDLDDSDSKNDVAKLLNPNYEADPNKVEKLISFDTAQELATHLADNTDAKYDPATQELSYSLNLSHELFDVDVPLNFDLDLAPIGNISSDASLLLSGDAGMSLTLGLSLGEVAGIAFIESNSPLTVNANAANLTHITANENVKGLNADGYKKILTDTTLTINGVVLSIENDNGYNSTFELVRAFNDAINDSSLTGQVEFSSQGKRLIISTTEDFTGTLTVTPNAELGFIAESGETVIKGNNYDFIITNQSGEEYGVSLDGKQTITLSELQETISSATNDKMTLGTNADKTALTLTDTQFAENTDGLFSLTPTNGSASAFLLGIFGVDANTEQGEIADGIIEGQPIAGASLADRFFMEDAKLWGEIDITTQSIVPDDSDQSIVPDDSKATYSNIITASANFGFVEIGLEGSGKLSAHLETGLKSPGDNTEIGSRVTLNQLMDNLGRYESLDKTQFDDEIRFNVWLNGTNDNGGNPYTVTLDADSDRNTVEELVDAINQQLNNHGINNYMKVVSFGSGFDIKLDSEANSDITFSLQGISDSAKEGLALPDNKTNFDLDNPFKVGYGKIHDVVATPTLTGTGGVGEDGQNIYGELTLTVSIDEKSDDWIKNLLVEGTGTPEIKLVAEHFGDPFGIDPNVEDGAVPKITVDTSGLDGFKIKNFGNFGFDGILDGLQAAADFLSRFESFGFLDEPIPLINHSVNDIIGFADDFNTALQEARNDPAGSIQKLEGKLENALGLKKGSNVIDMSLVDGAEDILKIELNLGADFADTFNMNLDLGEMGISGKANLDTKGKFTLDIDFGIALNDPANIYLFSTTGLAAFVNVDAKNVAFNSPIGSVKNGSVKIGAEFKVGMKGFSDRILMTDLQASEHFSLEFGGNLDHGNFIDSTLPIYLPLVSKHAGDLVIQAKDFSDIEISGWDEIMSGFDLSNLSLLDQVVLMVDGIDIFLEGLQDVMDGEIGGISLPFIGDGLEEGARFIEDFRNGFINDLRTHIENAATPDQNFISLKLFELLGPDGLNILLDNNSDNQIDINDIGLKTNVNHEGLTIEQQFMEWDMNLGGEVFSDDLGIDFDLGIPGLGLETKGDIALDINWALDLSFGISGTYGVYFNLFEPSTPELRFDVRATLDDAEIAGKLGFLQLTITEDEVDPTYLFASFAVDLHNKNDTDTKHNTKLSFSELGDLRITPKIAAEAKVNLDMVLSLNSDMVDEPAAFPNIRSDFVLDWSLGDATNSYIALTEIGDAIQHGLKLVEFQNVSLDLGSYISDFLGPTLKQIQDVTKPLQPMIDFITTPFPVLSDMGVELTFLDLAEYYSKGRFDAGFFESVAEIITFVNSIDVGGFDTVWINFGNLTIFDINDEKLKELNLSDTQQLSDNQAFLDNAIQVNDNAVETAIANSDDNTRSGDRSKSAGFYDKLKKNGRFDLPILNDPSQIFNLLLGKDATLITYDMKPLELGFEYQSPFITIFGPLGVRFGAGLGATIDFDFGFDTYGIRKFIDSDFVNPGLIFAGFFVDDGDHPELQITGRLWAAAELNLGIAYGGVKGGLEATVNFDLFDPDNDGKVRVDEMINSVAFADNNPLAVFDISGDVKAFIEWYVGVDLKFKKWEASGVITDFKLIDFKVDFPREPILASDLGSGVLQLNMGDLADQRLNGNTTDGSETFTVTDTGGGVQVSSSIGGSQTYNGIDKVVIRAGAGDDRIILNGSSNLNFDIEGGVGNDFIDVSGTSGKVIVHGDVGDDTIKTGSGVDTIWGDAGNDTIYAGGGTDWAFGDSGKVKESDSDAIEYIKVRTDGTDGADIIHGEDGDDILIGGGGLDKIYGGSDADLILGDRGKITFAENNTRSKTALTNNNIISVEETARGLEGGNDILHGDEGEDIIYGGVGYDDISGGDDNDTLYGEKGSDTINGDAGLDTVYGGEDNDKISGGEGVDTLYGEAGGDTIYGDNGEDQIYGGLGADILHGNADNDTIFGGSDPDLIYGDAGNDILDGEAGSDVVFGYTGNYASLSETEKAAITGYIEVDHIISSLGSDVLDGEGGGDQYTINMSGGVVNKHVTVFDTGEADSGADNMTINGTIEDDTFLLRSGVAEDAIAFAAMLNGDEDVERIDYDRQLEGMTINSFKGNDYFALDDNRAITTINGGVGNDTFQVGQMFATPRTVDANIQPHDNDKPHDGSDETGTDIFATIETTRGYLSNGISETSVINGGSGNDAFTVFHNKAVLGLNGGDGNDEFTIRSFALSGSQETVRERTDLSGGSDADLIQYALNAPVNIDGGDGMDEIRVIGTEFSDDYVITSKGVFGAGLNVNFVNIEVLKVDGAEGNDRFFVQSTEMDLVVKLVGGLGSDSFNVGGDVPPVISNDLLGHSGIISHTVESDDPNYDGIKVEGLSVNVADNDEPGIVITQSDGESVVGTVNGTSISEDFYTVILTHAPVSGKEVVVTALAPKAGEDALIKFKANGELKDSVQLVFDSTNWNTPQKVSFVANAELGSDPLFGMINHTLSNKDSITGTISEAVNDFSNIRLDQAVTSDLDLTGATIKITEGFGKGQMRGIESIDGATLNLRTAWNIVPDATSVYEILLVDGQHLTSGNVIDAINKTTAGVNGTAFGVNNPGGDLRGATLQIIGGTGAGQERLIMSNTADTLVLNKPWTTALDDSSQFQILRYGAVKMPSVDVFVNSAPTEPADLTQVPGVRVMQTSGSTDVIEGMGTDTYSLNLTQKPSADVKVYVQPEPTITTRGQIFYKEAQVETTGATLQSDENGQFLVFTPDNWAAAQTIAVNAIDDAVVDGGDTKVFAPMPKIINQVQGPLYMEGMGESEVSIGSLGEPLMLPGETNQKDSLGNVISSNANSIRVLPRDIPAEFGDLIDVTLEITAGAAKGDARIITGYNPHTGVIAFDTPWDEMPDDTSEFTLSITHPNLLVDETEQVDVVTIFNNDSLADDVGILTQDSLTGLGMGTDDLVLEGTPFKAGINYLEMENFTANLGKGDNQLTVNSTHTRDDGFRTVTLINAGQGDDHIDVNLDENQGLIAIKGETGNDNIDASDSELGIVAFGDEGNDQLTGGSGNDTLLGDRGRIDYLNEEGEVVTRLGLEHDFTKMFAVPQADDETPADQTDGVMRSPTHILSLYEDISGEDEITGLGGDDILIGGSGADSISGSEDNDIALGDNGYVDFAPDSHIETVATMTPLQGEGDSISGGAGNDLLFGGTSSDNIQGDSDNDLIFGDHGRVQGNVDLSALPLTIPPVFTFEAIDTKADDGGGDDLVHAGSGDDIVLGEQGADVIYGEAGDDDIIGGHNVKGGSDTGDRLDGGMDDDVIAGDNAIIERRGDDSMSLRIQTLTAPTLYDDNGVAQISGERHAEPEGMQIRDITLLDHSKNTQSGVYGADYIAGGADDDMLFGQLGDDKIQGDGSIDLPSDIAASVDENGILTGSPSVEAETDGDDYIEGNGGNDLIAGNLGQDDIIGGSSDLFGLTTPNMRLDGADLIFGGAGMRVSHNDPGLEERTRKNETTDPTTEEISGYVHNRDADVILGDNANIFRIINPADGAYLHFNHDLSEEKIVRAYTFLDYTLGGGYQDIGSGDELHGEGSDDILHGMTDNDVLFGEGQDDDLYGGSGDDRLYGGSGVDGILGDDGLIYTSRNGMTEPLYGMTQANHETAISLPGPYVGAVIHPEGELHKSVKLLAYDKGARGNGNDVIYGGLDDDFLHGGEGDDAISGAEAILPYYNSMPHSGTITAVIDGNTYTYQVDTPLPFDATTGKFEAYDADDPRTQIAGFLLDFDTVDAEGNKISDGTDRIYGDLGNDWLMGGTENDRLFGGWGNDLINADDNLATNNGLNDQPDSPEFADGDFAFGGADLDVLIANTGKDRMFDWSGEYNSYIVPFSPFGPPTVNRGVSPNIINFIKDLGLGGGADVSLSEPDGELALVTQKDSAWQDQKGGPRDPQPGNIPGMQIDDRGEPEGTDAGKGNKGTDAGKGNKGTGKPNDNQGNNQDTTNDQPYSEEPEEQNTGDVGGGSITNDPTSDDTTDDGGTTTTTTPANDTTNNGSTTTTTPSDDTTENGGTTTPPDNTTGNGGTTTITPPDNTTGNGGTTTTITPPDDTTGNGGTTTTTITPPDDTTDDGSTTPITPPDDTTDDGGTTPPPDDTIDDGGTTTPPDDTGDGGTTTPPDDTGNGGTTTPPDDSTDDGKDTGNPHDDDNPTGNPHDDGTGTGNPHDPQDDGTDTDKKDKNADKGNGKGNVKSAQGARLDMFRSEDAPLPVDVMLFDETSGVFVDSNKQPDSDALISDDFLIIEKGDALSSGSAGLIAW